MPLAMFRIFAATPEEVLYGYGPLGIGVVALSVLGYKMFNIILKDRDKAIADRDVMINDVFTKVLPAISRNTELLESRQALDRDLIDMVRRTNQQLENNTRAFDEIRYTLKPTQGSRLGGV